MKEKNRLSSQLLVLDLPDAGAPWKLLAMTSNLLASVRLTRKESAKARLVAWVPSGEFLNCSLNRAKASSWDP